MKIIPVTLSGQQSQIKTYALLDEGSTITLLDTEVARKIGIRGERVELSLSGIIPGGPLSVDSEKVAVSIQGSFKKHTLLGVHTMSRLNLPTQTLTKNLIENSCHLREIRIESYENAVPKILIGQDNIDIITASEVRSANREFPYASKTPLGWVVHGKTTEQRNHTRGQMTCTTFKNSDVDSKDDDLHRIVREYFAIDSIGIGTANRVSPEERRAYEILDSTTRRVENDWETGLLWRDDHSSFPESKEYAMKRLRGIEKKLDQDPRYAEMYYREMSRLIVSGFAEKTSDTKNHKRVWYLPHFGVTNQNKPGKIRLVFDAAAKVQGVSLNDRLISGPDLLQPLIGILMRFRQGKIAYKSDIRDMFLRVNLKDEDRDAQRFLWRGKDRSNPPE